MDKRREPLTKFLWRKDADGYALKPDGKIVRRGGKMVEYNPASVGPTPLHHIFAALMTQTWSGAESEGQELSDSPNAPFYMRGFDDLPSAMLAFVNEYGFLGSDRTGSDAESEDYAHLCKLSSSLNSVASWAQLQRSRSKLKVVLADTGVLTEAIPGPSLRMVLSLDRRQSRIQFHYEPESLYAWMWLRTADDMSNGIDWSGPPCLYCLQQMGRGGGEHRRHAEFCNGTHRTYFHRLSKAEQKKRREKARELARAITTEGV